MARNFYDLLNVPATATFEELKRNYKLLILQCHPDKLQQQQQGEQQLHQSETKQADSKRNYMTDKQDEDEDDDNDVTVNLCFSSSAAAACATTSDDLNVMMPPSTAEAAASSSSLRKKFVAINEAWNTLKDPIKRKLYDAELLQSKFQTHSNIFDTITYEEMRREEIEGEIADEEEEEDETTEVELAENYIDDENHVDAAALADKAKVGACDDAAAGTKATKTTMTVYYVYDCRCGGQYELDESAFETLRRSSSKHNDNKCRRRHHHQQQIHTQKEVKEETLHQQQERQSTSVKQQQAGNGAAFVAADNYSVDGVGDVDCIDNSKSKSKVADSDNDGEDDDVDDDVIVECSECSLVIIVKHNRK